MANMDESRSPPGYDAQGSGSGWYWSEDIDEDTGERGGAFATFAECLADMWRHYWSRHPDPNASERS